MIQPTDKVLIFEDGCAQEFDTYTNLKASSKRLKRLIEFYIEAGEDNVKNVEEAESRYCQKMLHKKRISELKETLRNFVKNLVKKARSLPPGQLAELVTKLPKNTAPLRIVGISGDIYMTVFRSAKSHYLLLLFLTILTTGVKVFSDWWIGQIKTNTSMSTTNKLLCYGGLVIIFGCLFVLAALATVYTSNRVTHELTYQTCKSLAYTNLDWFMNQRPLKVANKIGKDYEEIYQMNFVLQRIIRNMTFLMATLVLVGFSSYNFYFLGAGIILINASILYYFARAERELFALGSLQSDSLSALYE